VDLDLQVVISVDLPRDEGTEIDSNMEDSMVILLRVKEGIHHLRARAWPDAEWRRRNEKRRVWSSSRINNPDSSREVQVMHTSVG
jgi:hypothetical protein